MRRTLTLAVLALSLGALIGGTSPSALAQPAGGKTLIMALDQSDVRTLDPGREFEFGAAFVCLNVVRHAGRPQEPQGAEHLRAGAGDRVEGLRGRQGVHVQAPAERQARERQPVHRRGREVQPDAAQEPQGQPRLDDGPPQGGHRRRPDDGEDGPQRVVRRLAAGPVGPERGHHGLEARQGARGQRLRDRGQGRQGRGVAEPELGRQRPVHPQGLAEEQRHHHGAESRTTGRARPRSRRSRRATSRRPRPRSSRSRTATSTWRSTSRRTSPRP